MKKKYFQFLPDYNSLIISGMGLKTNTTHGQISNDQFVDTESIHDLEMQQYFLFSAVYTINLTT